jgi:hypothetical protein
MFGSTDRVPDGWHYLYLGMGNHLIVEASVFNEFAAKVKDLDDPVYLYQNWYRAAVETLIPGKQSSAKVKNILKRDISKSMDFWISLF